MADYISRQAAIEKLRSNLAYMRAFGVSRSLLLLNELPSADAVEVVRCKECKHYSMRESVCKLLSNNYEPPVVMYDEDYCSFGERKDD